MENAPGAPDGTPGTHPTVHNTGSGSSVYVDALPDHQLHNLHPHQVLDRQLTFLNGLSDNHSDVNSSFVYGAKPPWGWDYVLSFKMPQYLKHKHTNDTPPTSPQADQRINSDDKDGSGEDSDSRKPRATRKDRKVVRQRVEILSRLKSAGFVFSQMLVPSEGIILVRISLPEVRMKAKAVKIGMELKLKSDYGGGYLAFSPEREAVFVNYDMCKDRDCYFAPADRSIIIMGVLQSKEDWGCALNIEKLVHEGALLQAFAIHSSQERNMLIAETVWRRIWDPTYLPPFAAMKDYLGDAPARNLTIPILTNPYIPLTFTATLPVISYGALVARVTFYFVFASFYARRLLAVALLSIPIYIVYRLLQNVLVIAIMRWIFAIALTLWTTVFLETWKRRNANVSVEWGLDDYKEDIVDDTRPQFVGDRRFGFYSHGGFVQLDDLVEDDARNEESTKPRNGMEAGVNVSDLPRNRYQDPRIARNTRLQSLMVTLIFVFFVGSITFLLLWWRNDVIEYFLKRTGNEGFANAVPGVLNGVLITVFDSLWRVVSDVLTRRENHRTNQEFENSLVYKRFAFQFISNYISLFYIAFIKPNLETNTCIEGYLGHGPDCMVELETQLMSLVITKATIQQFMEIGVPYVTTKVKRWFVRNRSETETPVGSNGNPDASSADNHYVTEAHLTPYTETIEDYGELVLQFGYLVLFGLAFPPAAVVALVNNLIEGRLDAYKILALSQRVNADDAADIGAWYSILEFLNVMSVLSNAGLVVFTADAAGAVFGFNRVELWRGLLYRVVAFFVLEHVLLVVKGMAAVLIGDVPNKAKRRKARECYDIARWFDVGWRDAFRGNSLLVVDERQVELCGKFADIFEKASDDEDDRHSD